MLAGPSLLYAPIYLAKIEQLSYAFRWAEWCYPQRRDEISGRDFLMEVLLNYQQGHDVILAVGDPFRLRYWNCGCCSPINEALVIGGLVQSACLWLLARGSDYDHAAKDNDAWKLSKSFQQIIVHRQEMTSFALISHLLLETEKAHPNDAKKLLFCDARPGEEFAWANRRRWLANAVSWKEWNEGKQLPFAYVSADRGHAMSYRNAESLKRSFLLEKNYQEMLFTGLVTTRTAEQRYGGFLDDIQEGITKATELIYDDPKWSAQCLLKDPHVATLLARGNHEEQLTDYLLSLVNVGAYVRDSKLHISQKAYDNGLAVHKAADNGIRDPRIPVLHDTDLRSAFKCIERTQMTLLDDIIEIPIRTFAEPSAETLSARSKNLVALGAAGLALLGWWWTLRWQHGKVPGLQAPPDLHFFLRFGMFAIPFVSLVFLAIPLGEILGRRLRGYWIKAISIAGVQTLNVFLCAWILSNDWNTAVGALANWAVVLYVVHKYIQTHRPAPRAVLKRFLRRCVLYLMRLSHVWREVFRAKRNLSKPLPIPLWLTRL